MTAYGDMHALVRVPHKLVLWCVSPQTKNPGTCNSMRVPCT